MPELEFEMPEVVEAGAAAYHAMTCPDCLPGARCGGEPSDLDREVALPILEAAEPLIVNAERKKVADWLVHHAGPVVAAGGFTVAALMEAVEAIRVGVPATPRKKDRRPAR